MTQHSLKQWWSAAAIAGRWEVHRTTVPRIMARFGTSGTKFGSSTRSARRFTFDEVRHVEKLAQLGGCTAHGSKQDHITTVQNGEKQS